MDQLTAHLDRGWDLVQQGDLKGARASARRAVEADANSPEAHNLLGYVAAQEGDSDEALESYRQAMALDDGYIDPMLNAAEVLIHPLQEFDEAIALCDEVLEFAEGKEEIADALLLKFDALLGKGERDAAKAVLNKLPEGPFEGPMYPFMLGRALFESGDAERAQPLLEQAVERDPENGDAHYYLGLAAEERKDMRTATLEFLEAREIDLGAARPNWSPSKDVFQKAVERALGQLDAARATHINAALVLVADLPGMEIVAEGIDPRIPILLDGMDRDENDAPRFARVFVYQRNIERLCGGIEQLEDEVAHQLGEEIQHVVEHEREDGASDPKRAGRAGGGGDGGRSRDREREREREDPKPGKARTKKV